MNKSPSQLRAFLALTWYAFRAQTRNPASFAFGFIFPIVFISIFGLIGGSTPKITVGIPIQSDQTNPIVMSVKNQSFITIEQGSLTELQAKINEGKMAGAVDVKATGEQGSYVVNVYASSGYPQEAAALRALVNGVVDKTNLQLAGVLSPAISVTEKEISGRKPRYIDFALPGQIGFSLLSTAIFGTVFGLIYLKKAGILKRMFATPTRALTILLSQGASRLITSTVQVVLILAIGVFLFKFHLPHGLQTFGELMLISVLGLIAFLGFGYLIAGLSNDENAASPLTNLITLPQFLLSGTFFSTENLPTWLQPIANNLPLSYFNTAVRKVTTEGGSLPDTWPYLIGLMLWGIAVYLLAAKTFKWE
jgi:ABC-2 type transport system permease protein